MTKEEIKVYLEKYEENQMRTRLRERHGKDDDPFGVRHNRLSLCINCLPERLKEVILYKYFAKSSKTLYGWMAKGTAYKRLNKALEYLEFCMTDLEAIYDKNDEGRN